MNGIVCARMHLPKQINIHSHPHAQLLLPLHGSMYIETDEQRHQINESNLGFLPPDCVHAYQGDVGNEFLVMNIPDHMVVHEDMSMLRGGSCLLMDERWKAIRHLVTMELSGGQGLSTLNSLFYYLYQYITCRPMAASIRYINEHYTDELSVKTLAEIEHYNVAHYYDWFKAKTGTTPGDYIKKLRMEKAKELLVNTDYSILQIAEQVGYEFNSSFSRVFKEAVGISPTAYKKRCRVAAK